jgi:RNA polymerase sigma-70 factor (ECF subfamily)
VTEPVLKEGQTLSEPSASDQRASRVWAVYAEGVRFLALRALGDAQAAEDVAQETVLRAWRESTERKGEPITDPVAFIYGIARHVIVDARRSSKRTVALDLVDSFPASERDVLDALVSAEERSRLRTAMRALSRSERALLMMSYVEGMTSAAIAQRLGESAEAIRKRKSRAVQQLRDAFRAS